MYIKKLNNGKSIKGLIKIIKQVLLTNITIIQSNETLKTFIQHKKLILNSFMKVVYNELQK